ncbi:tyrosine-protein phosphatase [Nocardia mexicana]|uniref:Protein-tyrosine phosphatase n=1 Tax=Nocardia mexicana TaxID=279262 RepID=A0A370HCT2_9NOCA|nr:tyrosine-protein phosphatase [Nocardia mexicana]RDI54301.1 protein-tyrosine phosphatase [Nocardia mexicana]
MAISHVLRGSVAGLAAAFLAVLPTTGSVLAAPLVHTAPAESGQQQSLGISAPNARDIGGYPTQHGGGKIRYGLVYRTDALDKLTAADQQRLASLNIGKALDLRSPNEVKANPDKLPASIPYSPLPIWDPNNDFYLYVSNIVAGGPAVQQEKLGDGKAADFMRTYYRWMITDPTARGQFATAIKEIAAAPGAVLYHCTAGKDRTGWTTAILMSALGVPKGQIYKDYLASNDYLAASNKATMDALVQRGLVTDPSLFDPILGVQRDYLDAAFDQAEQSYGSFDRFLSDGLGVDGGTVDALKTKLLDKPGN